MDGEVSTDERHGEAIRSDNIDSGKIDLDSNYELASLWRQYDTTISNPPTGLISTLADVDRRLTTIRREITKLVSDGLDRAVAATPIEQKGQRAPDYFVDAHRAMATDKGLSSKNTVDMIGPQLLDWARRRHITLPLGDLSP